MTPAQHDHLQRIDAHLAKLLDIAAKRTPGEWGSQIYDVGQAESEARCFLPSKDPTRAWQRTTLVTTERHNTEDAAFIASCAGNAEAGWKATRAAIAAMAEYSILDENLGTMVKTILAAFPLESLNPPQL